MASQYRRGGEKRVTDERQHVHSSQPVASRKASNPFHANILNCFVRCAKRLLSTHSDTLLVRSSSFGFFDACLCSSLHPFN